MKQFSAFFHFEVSAETLEEARGIARKKLTSVSDNDLKMVEIEPKTVRCDDCHRLYARSDVCEIDGRTVCVECGISPDDIPF
jgi:formylmethanofuran dehydrogenase subunit E